ncbi:RlpA-like double-psi beta-barrel-protein domain-containing protein-containing protein [Fomitopsis serialis]|uniref:RlpA-like double-psi beta-barrel-protein domain-containing protein-containing protein n=1 Tax=Fomitopsis serialis TaxID=139415 RepID=UPI002007C62B|nr:RlpA-like double-psi beta-barrel-protein domain-containing protein-containing protein [Neoantrodia serialis]KAH9930960.1 RlpA-like double-psi beta-barrel-protein domain-containing protein-containing protein [Neoantrodia serialis]
MHYRSILGTLVFFSLLGLGLGHLDSGTPRSKHGASWRRHMERSMSLQNTTSLERRVDGARLTYYDAGQNACGGYDSDNDFVVALNAPQWDNGAHCYKTITIWYAGKSTQAKVTDMCPGCPWGGLDLSRGLFSFLADLGLGVLSASWDFDDGSKPQLAADLQAAYTPYAAHSTTHAPSTTQWTPTHTVTTTYRAPESYAAYSSFSTATMTFSPYASVSGTLAGVTTSATSSATATPASTVAFDQGTLNRVNLAIVGLSGLAEAANWV